MKKLRIAFVTCFVFLLALIALCGCDLFGGGSSSGNTGGTSNGGQQTTPDPEPEKPEFESGSGTEEDPYIIAQAYQWANINKHLKASYLLDADINMGDMGTMASVGSDTAPFEGTLDGQGHYIHSATILGSPFAVVSGGTVINFSIRDSQLIKATGGLFGTVKMGALIENCHGSALNVSAQSNQYLGGIVGEVASAAQVRYCSANVAYNASNGGGNKKIGPIVGYLQGGHVDACWVTGSFAYGGHLSMDAGGILGAVSGGTITNCYAQCTMTGSPDSIGGIGHWRTGGTLGYLLNLCDATQASPSKNRITSDFVETTIKAESTLRYFSPAVIETSNDVLDTDEWKDNKVWKKGKIHPELVSYEEYLAITAEK